MKSKVFTSIIVLSLMVSFTSCFCSPCYAARLTRKQKKERALLDVAKTSFEDKQYDTAIEYYTKAIRVNPDNADTYAKRGNAEYLLGKYKEAVTDYSKAIELDPKRENLKRKSLLQPRNCKIKFE